MHDYRLNLKLSKAQRMTLERLADERNISMSDAARMLMFDAAPENRHRRRDNINRTPARVKIRARV